MKLLKRNRDQQESTFIDDDYDGYYEDVRPVDEGTRREGLDPDMAKRVIILAAGTVGIIILAVVLMTLL